MVVAAGGRAGGRRGRREGGSEDSGLRSESNKQLKPVENCTLAACRSNSNGYIRMRPAQYFFGVARLGRRCPIVLTGYHNSL